MREEELDSCRAGQRAVAGVRRAEGAGRNLSEFSLRDFRTEISPNPDPISLAYFLIFNP